MRSTTVLDNGSRKAKKDDERSLLHPCKPMYYAIKSMACNRAHLTHPSTHISRLDQFRQCMPCFASNWTLTVL